MREHRTFVKLFLDKKAATHAVGLMSEMSGTPLHAAAREGHVATMELLIARGVPLVASQFGKTALHVAAGAGQLEAMKLLLAKGMKVDTTVPQMTSGTPLFEAVSEGQLAAVQFLIEKGANVNAKELGQGRTPLHEAMKRGDLREARKDIVLLLLDKKADLNAKDTSGKTPLALALENRNEDAAALLRAHGATQ